MEERLFFAIFFFFPVPLQIATVIRYYYTVSVIVTNNTVHLQTYFKEVHVPEKKKHDSAKDSTLDCDALPSRWH
jgi:hypothetical protein